MSNKKNNLVNFDGTPKTFESFFETRIKEDTERQKFRSLDCSIFSDASRLIESNHKGSGIPLPSKPKLYYAKIRYIYSKSSKVFNRKKSNGPRLSQNTNLQKTL